MAKNGSDSTGQRRVTGRPTGGGAYPHLWPLRMPILQWIPDGDLAPLDQWFALAAAEAAREGGMPAPSLEAAGAALAADVAWLGDFLAWVGAYRQNADLRRMSDLRVGRAAAAAAGWLAAPVAALAGTFGPIPATWDEEEAVRRFSRLFLPDRFASGLEWATTLAYVTGLYYETPEIDPELHLPALLEVAKGEAAVLLGQVGSLAAVGGLTGAEKEALAVVAQGLTRVFEAHPLRTAEPKAKTGARTGARAGGEAGSGAEATARWTRRPAVPSRRR